MGNVRLIAATSDGGPNGPVNPLPLRVSTNRHGVIAMKVSGSGAIGAAANGCNSARSGCQYSGAGQWRRGTWSRWVWAHRSIGTTARTQAWRNRGVFIVQLSRLSGVLGYVRYKIH